MSELEFYRIMMAGMGSVTLALVVFIWRASASKLGTIDRRLAGFIQAVMHLMITMHPDRGVEVVDTLKCYLMNGGSR